MSSYGITITSAPPIEPISLSEIKVYLKIDHTDEDSLLTDLIRSARIEIETLTRRHFIERTVAQTHDCFPSGDKLELKKAPVQSITSVAYVDVSGTNQTFSADNYRLVTDRIRPFIRLKNGVSWPSVELSNDVAVTLTYLTGYGSASSSVPENVRRALRIAIAFAYENRGDGHMTVNESVVRDAIRSAAGPSMILETV